jgi:voltage-gated potassium channel
VQTLATLRSRYPLLRSVEAMAMTIPLFIVVFSTTHYLINGVEPASYSEPMTRFDALYFTMTTFATVGFGDITPVSLPARLVTLLQMIGGLILVGVVARVLISAARFRQDRR